MDGGIGLLFVRDLIVVVLMFKLYCFLFWFWFYCYECGVFWL